MSLYDDNTVRMGYREAMLHRWSAEDNRGQYYTLSFMAQLDRAIQLDMEDRKEERL